MARKNTVQAAPRGKAGTQARRSPRANRASPSPSAPPRAGQAGRPARKSSYTRDDSRALCVRLTPQQVGELVGQLLSTTGERQEITITHLLAGLIVSEDIPPFPHWEARYRGDCPASQFSLSTLKAILVLAHLVGGEHMSIIDIAKRLQLGSSAIHRYLSTLQILGIVEQDPKTRKYRLAS